MSATNPRTTAAAPNNAVLANTVAPSDLKQQKKHLDHVPIERAPVTAAGGVHVGPSADQADFNAPQREHHTSTSATGSRATGGNAVDSSHSGEVSVQSSVTIDTTQETKPQAAATIQALLSRLSTTTSQIDDYSKRRNEAISEDCNKQLAKIIGNTQFAQDQLLSDASARSLAIESEYAVKLKSFLQELDASKAANLASLEKDLNLRQQTLLANARDEMDRIHQQMTDAKIAVMQDANRNTLQQVDQLTDQVRTLGEAEVERRMKSTTTTVITTNTTTASDASATIGDKTNVTTDITNESRMQQTTVVEPRATTRV